MSTGQMNIKRIVVTLILLCSWVTPSYATIHYLGVNNITQQYCIFESGGIYEYEPIGWSYAPWEIEVISELEAEGYTKTEFPYFIESLFLVFLVIGYALIRVNKAMKNRPQKNVG